MQNVKNAKINVLSDADKRSSLLTFLKKDWNDSSDMHIQSKEEKLTCQKLKKVLVPLQNNL